MFSHIRCNSIRCHQYALLQHVLKSCNNYFILIFYFILSCQCHRKTKLSGVFISFSVNFMRSGQNEIITSFCVDCRHT